MNLDFYWMNQSQKKKAWCGNYQAHLVKRTSKFSRLREKILYPFFWDQRGMIVQRPVEKEKRWQCSIMQIFRQPAASSTEDQEKKKNLRRSVASKWRRTITLVSFRKPRFEIWIRIGYSSSSGSVMLFFRKLKSELHDRSFESTRRSVSGRTIFQSRWWSDDVSLDAHLNGSQNAAQIHQSEGDYFETEDILFCKIFLNKR